MTGDNPDYDTLYDWGVVVTDAYGLTSDTGVTECWTPTSDGEDGGGKRPIRGDETMTTDAYKAAGVDIDAGEAVVDGIRSHVARTQRPGVLGSIGGFGALFSFKVGLKTPFW